MNPSTVIQAGPARKVIVEGKILVGKRIRTRQGRRAAERFRRLSDDEIRARGIDPASRAGQTLAYGNGHNNIGALPKDSFRRTAKSVWMKDAGFTASYGVFGSPGTGKTHLILYLLSQILGNIPDRSSPAWQDSKFGALILDPKAALVDDVTAVIREVRPGEQLIVLNTDELAALGQQLNVIDCALAPRELGRLLVLVAQSAGVETTEPFWFLAWENLFSAALTVLALDRMHVVTLRDLVSSVLEPEDIGSGIRVLAEQIITDPAAFVKAKMPATETRAAEIPDMIEGARRAARDILAHYENTLDQKRTVRIVDSLIRRAYGSFLERRYACFSAEISASMRRYGWDDSVSFYDDIIENGRVVLVSISPSEPDFAKVLCTLVKCLFQQTVMGRKERARRPAGAAGRLSNYRRPVLIACDEYSEVATELPGKPIGDGHFFALARENGCMGLLATQSVNVLENSSLKQSWRSVFSNFGAKFFLGAADNETVEEATKLAGEEDWEVLTHGESLSLDGESYTKTREIRERKALPARILTRLLAKGEAVVIGSLDGRKTRPSIRTIRVPESIPGIQGTLPAGVAENRGKHNA